jgi:hypothetical protein
VRRRGEADTQWNGDRVSLGRADIRNIDERRADRGRTALAATVFTAVGVGLVAAFAKMKGLVSGNGGRPPVPGT